MPRPRGAVKKQLLIRLLSDNVDRMRWILRNPAKAKNPYATSVVNYGSVNSLFDQLLKDWLKDVMDKLPSIEEIQRDLYGDQDGDASDG